MIKKWLFTTTKTFFVWKTSIITCYMNLLYDIVLEDSSRCAWTQSICHHGVCLVMSGSRVTYTSANTGHFLETTSWHLSTDLSIMFTHIWHVTCWHHWQVSLHNNCDNKFINIHSSNPQKGKNENCFFCLKVKA